MTSLHPPPSVFFKVVKDRTIKRTGLVYRPEGSTSNVFVGNPTGFLQSLTQWRTNEESPVLIVESLEDWGLDKTHHDRRVETLFATMKKLTHLRQSLGRGGLMPELLGVVVAPSAAHFVSRMDWDLNSRLKVINPEWKGLRSVYVVYLADAKPLPPAMSDKLTTPEFLRARQFLKTVRDHELIVDYGFFSLVRRDGDGLLLHLVADWRTSTSEELTERGGYRTMLQTLARGYDQKDLTRIIGDDPVYDKMGRAGQTQCPGRTRQNCFPGKCQWDSAACVPVPGSDPDADVKQAYIEHLFRTRAFADLNYEMMSSIASKIPSEMLGGGGRGVVLALKLPDVSRASSLAVKIEVTSTETALPELFAQYLAWSVGVAPRPYALMSYRENGLTFLFMDRAPRIMQPDLGSGSSTANRIESLNAFPLHDYKSRNAFVDPRTGRVLRIDFGVPGFRNKQLFETILRQTEKIEADGGVLYMLPSTRFKFPE